MKLLCFVEVNNLIPQKHNFSNLIHYIFYILSNSSINFIAFYVFIKINNCLRLQKLHRKKTKQNWTCIKGNKKSKSFVHGECSSNQVNVHENSIAHIPPARTSQKQVSQTTLTDVILIPSSQNVLITNKEEIHNKTCSQQNTHPVSVWKTKIMLQENVQPETLCEITNSIPLQENVQPTTL